MRRNKQKSSSSKITWKEDWKRNHELYLFLLPAFIVLLIFNYWPMYGIQIAFKDFKPMKGIWGSKWVGLKWFKRFFSSYQFVNVTSNTILLSIELLLFTFPLAIILALIINQYTNLRFKKSLQTISYAPHFISTVVMCGMISLFLNPNYGLYAHLMRALGRTVGNPLGESSMFRTIYILSDIWQHTGWNSIIYVAALSSVDPTLYDAATVDGASRFQKIRYIELPALAPTATLIFIMSVGSVMSIGFEKAYLLQNDMNMKTSEIIATYVYKMGLTGSPQYSYSAAVGLFNSLVNMLLLVFFNKLSRVFGKTSLW